MMGPCTGAGAGGRFLWWPSLSARASPAKAIASAAASAIATTTANVLRIVVVCVLVIVSILLRSFVLPSMGRSAASSLRALSSSGTSFLLPGFVSRPTRRTLAGGALGSALGNAQIGKKMGESALRRTLFGTSPPQGEAPVLHVGIPRERRV